MSNQFTPGPGAQRRGDTARALARWCYRRGIGPAIASQQPQVLRAAARAAGVNPPHVDDGHSSIWQLVAELLHARAAWDRAHGQPPPAAAVCIACTALAAVCARHSAARAGVCRGCHDPLDPALIAAGLDLHPTCPAPPPTVPTSDQQVLGFI